LAVADATGTDLEWCVIDAIPISHTDVTGIYALRDLRQALKAYHRETRPVDAAPDEE